MTSLFYGLRQEIKARGAPVDENRYWYEFLAPLAKMRVDGLMEGPDGNLTQIETITFSFHWFLAPLFWMLRPLFNKQKEDILRDDSALLERVCELDKTGFKRLEPGLPRVVLYGGDGFFGHLVVEDLLKYSSVEIIVASRHPKSKAFHSSETRVRIVESDVNDYASVLSTIEDAKVVVSCIGPYQGQSLNLLRACIEKHVAYVDVADDRDFVLRCHQIASEVKTAGISAFVGSLVQGRSIRGVVVPSSVCYRPSEMNSPYRKAPVKRLCTAGQDANKFVFRRQWDIDGSILSSTSLIISSSHSTSTSRLWSSRSARN